MITQPSPSGGSNARRHGREAGARTRFTGVVPTDIELVNWDEMEEKSKNGRPVNGSPKLFE